MRQEYVYGGDEGIRTPVQNTFLSASYNHTYIDFTKKINPIKMRVIKTPKPKPTTK
jgi:hypothetical protein